MLPPFLQLGVMCIKNRMQQGCNRYNNDAGSGAERRRHLFCRKLLDWVATIFSSMMHDLAFWNLKVAWAKSLFRLANYNNRPRKRPHAATPSKAIW
jgi:hypothetical protein